MFKDYFSSKRSLRVVKTARDEKSINKAARRGLFPLVKKVEFSEEIRSKYAVFQSEKTGEIQVIGDYRAGGNEGYQLIIDFTYYYPHVSKSPFAAYLVPNDIEIGERVFLEDLIEDFIGTSWNQGDTYRLKSCEAIWNGESFDVQYEADTRSEFVG